MVQVTNHRFLNEKDRFANYAFDVLKAYFDSRQEFDEFFEDIATDEDKDKFLRITSFYKFLVKDGSYYIANKKSNKKKIDYIDDTFKYVALYSFIEALYAKDTYVEFYEWLCRNKDNSIFPIESVDDLKKLYNAYKKEHGSIRKAVSFFESLDSECKKILKTQFEVISKSAVDKPQNNVKSSVDDGDSACANTAITVLDLAKKLYEIRSRFVHEAKLVTMFSGRTTLSKSRDNIFVCCLSLDDLKMFFEHGLLIFFGYSGSFKHPKARKNFATISEQASYSENG